MQVILANSEEDIGQYFDHIIASDDYRIKRGRPFPDEVWAAMIAVSCDHPSSCIKVDDTGVGILSGIHAGTKTMGVIRYSNFTRLHTDDIDILGTTNLSAYMQVINASRKHMEEFNPTYVCQTFKGLVPLIKLCDINTCNSKTYSLYTKTTHIIM